VFAARANQHTPARTRNVRDYTRKRLQEFWHTHPEAELPLKAWLAIVRLKRYSSPQEVRQDFASASFLGKWRAVFDIGGNKYCLVVDMRYDLGRIYIRQLLTHAEYDPRTQGGSL
jgi:mRNA interferase HigB